MPRSYDASDSIEFQSLGRFAEAKIVRHKQPITPSSPCALARYLMRRKFVVWDTETTGLEDDAKIVSIGVVDQDGNVLLDTLINPGEHIPRDATAIHGVTDDMVANAPTFAEIYLQIREALEGKIWVIYNQAYDKPRLTYECRRYYLPRIYPAETRQTVLRDRRKTFANQTLDYTFCMMESFAIHYGDYSEYWGNYKWKNLATAAHYYGIKVDNAHNALADAFTTLHLIRAMAFDEDKNRL